MHRGINSSKKIEFKYNSDKYKNKKIIILGVHSHVLDFMNNPNDREFYYLSCYLKGNKNYIVCSTSTPNYFKKLGYVGYEYIEKHFKVVKFIGKDVWYDKKKRLTGAQAVDKLHNILKTIFNGQQVILLRPGTPYVCDEITENLLNEVDASNKYLVIDDLNAPIYKFIDKAIELLNVPKEIIKNYIAGYKLAKIHDISDLIKPNQLNCIVSVQNIYSDDRASKSLLEQVIDRLKEKYNDLLPVVIAAPNIKVKRMTLKSFYSLISQDISFHSNIHYSIVLYPGERKK